MKIFKNKQLTESIDPTNLDLEIVEGGSSRKYTYYLLNDHPRGSVRNLKIIVDNKEITNMEYPTSIGRNESVPFSFNWQCDSKLEEGIRPKWRFTYDIICGPTPG